MSNETEELRALRTEVDALRASLARVEAKDAVQALFHRYLYALDLDRADEVVACFAWPVRCECVRR